MRHKETNKLIVFEPCRKRIGSFLSASPHPNWGTGKNVRYADGAKQNLSGKSGQKIGEHYRELTLPALSTMYRDPYADLYTHFTHMSGGKPCG